jgi:hypothetical protein
MRFEEDSMKPLERVTYRVTLGIGIIVFGG